MWILFSLHVCVHVFSLSTQYLETSVPQHFPLILFHHSASHIPEEIQCTSPLLINTCLLIIFKPYSSWSWISSLQEVSMLLSHNGCLVAQLCPPLCIPLDCSTPGSSVNEILHARILEKVAMPSSKGDAWPRDQTGVFCALQTYSLPTEPLGKPCHTDSNAIVSKLILSSSISHPYLGPKNHSPYMTVQWIALSYTKWLLTSYCSYSSIHTFFSPTYGF